MFNEKHFLNNNEDFALAFIKSKNIKVYPCGRRRSEFVNITEGSTTGQNEGYYIPFDPEARLNTEANNRKSVGINSFTQTYVNKFPTETETETEKKLTLVSLSIAGYLFDINLDEAMTATDVGAAVEKALDLKEPLTDIYANIRIQSVPLFSDSGLKYYTQVLRNQTASQDPSTTLDLLCTSQETPDKEDINNYYFSGLSFTAKPITDYISYETENVYYVDSIEETSWCSKAIYEKADKVNVNPATDTLYQYVVSLHILTKKDDDDKWQVYQPALLPEIAHGETEGSIKVPGVITAGGLTLTDGGSISTNGTIAATTIKRDAKEVPVIDLVQIGDANENKWQLQISFANTSPKTE